MGYTNYRGAFKAVARQHNIMALVGNGFDIQALSSAGSKMDTRYETFYYYLKSRKFPTSNLLMQVMEEAKDKGRRGWSDIEAGIENLLGSGTKAEDIEDSLDALQVEFSAFLDSVVTPEVLTCLSSRATEQAATVNSLASFFGDVHDEEAYARMSTLQRMDFGDLFNFRFVNFNYTPLLDNFVFLDKKQFDPHPYKSSDRNLDFRPNPRGFDHRIGFKGGAMVSYVITEVVHPHGVQHTPRSILFGVDSAPRARAPRLEKPYWAQNKVLHETHFAETHLFIVFGCSLGDSDQWWWKNIAYSLESSVPALDNPDKLPPDLLLYWRLGPGEIGLTQQEVLEKFASGAGRAGDSGLMATLQERAYVVLYDDQTDRAWLRT